MFYAEFIETNPSKAVLATGLKPADVMVIDPIALTDEEIATLNNRAYAARSTWSALAFFHFCVCVAAVVTGVFLLFAATQNYPLKLPLSILAFFVVYAVIQFFALGSLGSFQIIIQVLRKTIEIAEYSGFPKILSFSIGLNKLSFVSATLLAAVAGITLLRIQTTESEVLLNHLRNQVRLLNVTLYVSTIILVSAIVFWIVTMQWALVYIYPPDGPVYSSFEALTKSQIVGSGIYYSILLALSYIPVAAIQYRRASKLAEQSQPGSSLKQHEDWLKNNGLSLSPMDFIPRLAAIFGPLLAGSVTELFKLIQ